MNEETKKQNQNRGFGQGGQRGGFNRPRFSSDNTDQFYEKVVQVNRVSKKTKGGDKRSLSVLVVVGDRQGKVGVGLGKAADVQSAVRKASSYGKKHLITVPLKDNRTIPHEVLLKLGAAKVLLKPAPAGTGVIAGGAVRVVVEAAGIRDIVSKVLGTSNQASNVYAALEALKNLKNINGKGNLKVETGKKVKSKEDKKE
ncbi:30S ribosomal protein S5 [Candidatus Daviesbacteria bacterium]|nr:30S ribosomal protein S5 [Candidatus Daviesbacteria bacterium]